MCHAAQLGLNPTLYFSEPMDGAGRPPCPWPHFLTNSGRFGACFLGSEVLQMCLCVHRCSVCCAQDLSICMEMASSTAISRVTIFWSQKQGVSQGLCKRADALSHTNSSCVVC